MKSNDNLTKELLLESVSKFADIEIAQHWKFIDETGNLPEGLFAKMVNFGFLSLTIPEEYGGSGFDYDIAWEVAYEISKRSASIGCILEGHYKTIDQIKRFASDRLKEEFLPQGNQRIFGFSSTEPSGGTNVRNMRTEAFYQDNHWILNGSKVMITNGGLAEVYCVIAKTGENEFSCVLVDMNMPGFEFGARENFMGLRGCPVGTLFFDNIRVPEYHLLGQREQKQ